MCLQITEPQNSLKSGTWYRQIVVQNVTVLSSLYETNQKKKKKCVNRKKWTLLCSIYKINSIW